MAPYIRQLLFAWHLISLAPYILLAPYIPSLVADEECAFSTQKQALNALAFFFKNVCRIENPVFAVKLKKTDQRMPVVLSKEEADWKAGISWRRDCNMGRACACKSWSRYASRIWISTGEF